MCWYKKVVQNCQGSSKHVLDLGARVLNFKEVYLSHLLVFLSDYKDIFLFKGLSINHFKSLKEFPWGRGLMRKKDYKSSRWTPNFPCVTSNDHNLVNLYHLEPTFFPQWSWGCELYSFFYMQSEKMYGTCPKDTKGYRSFNDFLPTSTIHNSLNFWIFWMVKVSKFHSRGLFHSIFFGQEKIPSGRKCLDANHYRSFFKKNLKYF